jgi:hypothetical protein
VPLLTLVSLLWLSKQINTYHDMCGLCPPYKANRERSTFLSSFMTLVSGIDSTKWTSRGYLTLPRRSLVGRQLTLATPVMR